MSEQQYNSIKRDFERYGPVKMGMCASHTWRNDPKRLLFVLARYKFVAQMMEGLRSILEVGCGDAFASHIIKAINYSGYDIDHTFIADAKENSEKIGNFLTLDFVHQKGPPGKQCYDGVFSLDVLEHIEKKDEEAFLENIAGSLWSTSGVCIIGTPSEESQIYASELSKKGHVNCKSGDELKTLMQRYFRNVFLFSMNDEVVHTGFTKMAHYLLALCVSPK